MKKTAITLQFCIFCALFMISCSPKKSVEEYKGIPFEDDKYKAGPQVIPGKIQCEYYDFGGEGVAFHDTDSTNSGSGSLNKADGSYLHEFRINEAVDISYTKVDDRLIDNSPYNLVNPEPNQLYTGWTWPGEWLKYTVDVKEAGTYQVGIMYTSNQDGKIGLSINDISVVDSVLIPNTFNAEDTIQWRNWHHWNKIDSLTELNLEKGLQVLTLHTVAIGNMNYDYLEFTLKQE